MSNNRWQLNDITANHFKKIFDVIQLMIFKICSKKIRRCALKLWSISRSIQRKGMINYLTTMLHRHE